MGVSDRHIAYDPKTGVTAKLAALPQRRHHPHGIDHKGKLYFVGGFGSSPDSRHVDHVDRYRWPMTTRPNSWIGAGPRAGAARGSRGD